MLNAHARGLLDALDAEMHPATLTVYTSAGTFTVEGVREDSIVLNGTTLTAEAQDKSMRLFTFVNVGGYSTII